jgi:hypothetical protein
MDLLVIIPLVLAVILLIRIFADRMDRARIADYVRRQGGQVRDVRWSPFGRGWFGEKSDRIYEVAYTDREGGSHHATCKTSLFTGVYWTEDKVIGGGAAPTPPADEAERLRAENARLRDELDRRENRAE